MAGVTETILLDLIARNGASGTLHEVDRDMTNMAVAATRAELAFNGVAAAQAAATTSAGTAAAAAADYAKAMAASAAAGKTLAQAQAENAAIFDRQEQAMAASSQAAASYDRNLVRATSSQLAFNKAIASSAESQYRQTRLQAPPVQATPQAQPVFLPASTPTERAQAQARTTRINAEQRVQDASTSRGTAGSNYAAASAEYAAATAAGAADSEQAALAELKLAAAKAEVTRASLEEEKAAGLLSSARKSELDADQAQIASLERLAAAKEKEAKAQAALVERQTRALAGPTLPREPALPDYSRDTNSTERRLTTANTAVVNAAATAADADIAAAEATRVRTEAVIGLNDAITLFGASSAEAIAATDALSAANDANISTTRNRTLAAAELSRALLAQTVAEEAAEQAGKSGSGGTGGKGNFKYGYGGFTGGFGGTGSYAISRALFGPEALVAGGIAALGVKAATADYTLDSTVRGAVSTTTVQPGDVRKIEAALPGITAATGNQQTQQDVADALYPVLSRGYSLPDSLAVAKEGAIGAEVTGIGGKNTISAADYTSVLTGALSTFAAKATPGQSFQDVAKDYNATLNTIINKGAADAPDIPTALSRFGPSANAAGADFKQSGALFASLTNNGITSRQAGEDVNAFYHSVLHPAVEESRISSLLGIERGPDAIKNAGGTANYLADIDRKTGGDQTLISALFANQPAAAAVITSTGRFAEGYQGIDKAVQDSNYKNITTGKDIVEDGDFAGVHGALNKLKDDFTTGLGGALKTAEPQILGLIGYLRDVGDAAGLAGSTIDLLGKLLHGGGAPPPASPPAPQPDVNKPGAAATKAGARETYTGETSITGALDSAAKVVDALGANLLTDPKTLFGDPFGGWGTIDIPNPFGDKVQAPKGTDFFKSFGDDVTKSRQQIGHDRQRDVDIEQDTKAALAHPQLITPQILREQPSDAQRGVLRDVLNQYQATKNQGISNGDDVRFSNEEGQLNAANRAARAAYNQSDAPRRSRADGHTDQLYRNRQVATDADLGTADDRTLGKREGASEAAIIAKNKEAALYEANKGKNINPDITNARARLQVDDTLIPANGQTSDKDLARLKKDSQALIDLYEQQSKLSAKQGGISKEVAAAQIAAVQAHEKEVVAARDQANAQKAVTEAQQKSTVAAQNLANAAATGSVTATVAAIEQKRQADLTAAAATAIAQHDPGSLAGVAKGINAQAARDKDKTLAGGTIDAANYQQTLAQQALVEAQYTGSLPDQLAALKAARDAQITAIEADGKANKQTRETINRREEPVLNQFAVSSRAAKDDNQTRADQAALTAAALNLQTAQRHGNLTDQLDAIAAQAAAQQQVNADTFRGNPKGLKSANDATAADAKFAGNDARAGDATYAVTKAGLDLVAAQRSGDVPGQRAAIEAQRQAQRQANAQKDAGNAKGLDNDNRAADLNAQQQLQVLATNAASTQLQAAQLGLSTAQFNFASIGEIRKESQNVRDAAVAFAKAQGLTGKDLKNATDAADQNQAVTNRAGLQADLQYQLRGLTDQVALDKAKGQPFAADENKVLAFEDKHKGRGELDRTSASIETERIEAFGIDRRLAAQPRVPQHNDLGDLNSSAGSTTFRVAGQGPDEGLLAENRRLREEVASLRAQLVAGLKRIGDNTESLKSAPGHPRALTSRRSA